MDWKTSKYTVRVKFLKQNWRKTLFRYLKYTWFAPTIPSSRNRSLVPKGKISISSYFTLRIYPQILCTIFNISSFKKCIQSSFSAHLNLQHHCEIQEFRPPDSGYTRSPVIIVCTFLPFCFVKYWVSFGVSEFKANSLPSNHTCCPSSLIVSSCTQIL